MSECKECYHSYVCLNHGTNFGDCPMIQEDYMPYKEKIMLDEKGNWIATVDKISHKIIVEEIKLPKEKYIKRNINLRRD